MMIHHFVFYYRHDRREDSELRSRVREIASKRVMCGHQRICILIRREGWQGNHIGI
jgi:putative transposase